MKSKAVKYYMLICCIILGIILPGNLKAEEDIKEAMKSDKTGTNPINFTYDLRFYNEFQWLNTAGDGHQNISTVEFRAPIFDGKWQFRVKARGVSTKYDMNNDGSTDVDTGGFGDTDIRFLTVPHMDMANKFALAVGFETFLNTASKDELGTGTTAFGPQIFAVFFKPLGGFFDLVAPAYQHRFSVDEDKGRNRIEQGLIDVFALKMSKDKQSWMLVNPTYVMDFETNKEFLLIDFEVGTMLDRYLGTKGHSAYLRPGFSIGTYRPVDASIEVGYKIIW